MKFVKGKSGNPNGRPALTAVGEIREVLRKRNINLINDLFDCLEKIEDPVQKATQIFKLMEYLYSKPKEIEITPEQAAEVLRDALRMARTFESAGESGEIQST